MSSCSSDQRKADAAPPFHVLMSGDGPSKRGIMDRTLRGDYLSQRYRALHDEPRAQKEGNEPIAQKEDGASNGRNDPLWLGVSSLEQALASCCELPVKGPEALVGGSLEKEKVLRFVGVLTLHCHDIGSRSLALAVLERSMQVDEEERLAQEYYSTLSGGSSDASGVDATEPSPKKRRRKALFPTTEGGDDSEEKSSDVPAEKLSQNRIEGFLSAGGLLILSRWLIEATAPVTVPKPKPPPGAGGRPQRTSSPVEQKPSSTGPLLLPLLAFLSNMSFDRQLVTQSKINKQIRKLSKQIDEIVESGQDGQQQKSKADAITHPVAGGMPVSKVQKALNDLKESWGLKAKNACPESSTSIDPFAALKNTLKERLDTIINCGAGRAEKPAWLAKLEHSQIEKEKKRPPKNRPSTEQLAKKERENEKSAMMREDLRKAAQERSELLKKLREMKQRAEVDGQMDRKRQAQARRSVRWKDGLGAASVQRKRDLLEEVFVFMKHKAEHGKVDKQASTDPGDADEDPSIGPGDVDEEDLFVNEDQLIGPGDVDEEDLFTNEDQSIGPGDVDEEDLFVQHEGDEDEEQERDYGDDYGDDLSRL
jgi:hypothetical protein